MDGAVIGAIAGIGVPAVGVIITFWRQTNSINRAIGRLEGKIDGLSDRVDSNEKSTSGLSERIDRLDARINGFVNKD